MFGSILIDIMKIGIVTMPLGLNFGGMMQNWALQHVLRGLGHDPITLRCDLIESTTWWRDFAGFLFRNGMGGVRWLSGSPFRMRPLFPNRTRSANARFLKEHIALSGVGVPFKPLAGCDAYIVGSDQVWRPDFVRDIYDMYLQFVDSADALKLAYAASFGTDAWTYTERQTDVCRSLVADFKAVSVREQSGVGLCRDWLGVDAVAVLDPTLLVDKTGYCELAESVPERHYDVGIYVLDPTRDKVRITGDACQAKGKRRCDINPYKSSMEEWLAMFRDSSFVVTDSFHGCVFSIIFKKDFVAIGNAARGLARFFDLLGPLGLKDRIVPDGGDVKKIIDDKINWIKVYEVLNARQSESMAFLRSNLC